VTGLYWVKLNEATINMMKKKQAQQLTSYRHKHDIREELRTLGRINSERQQKQEFLKYDQENFYECVENINI